jgi:hypothetical protein
MNWYAYANGNPVSYVDPDGLQAASSYALMGIGGGGMSGWANPQSYQALGSAMMAAQQAGYTGNITSAAADAEFSRNVDRMATTYVATTAGLATATFGGPVIAAGYGEAAVIGRVGVAAVRSAAADIAEMSALANVASIEAQAAVIARAPWLLAATAKVVSSQAANPMGSRVSPWGEAKRLVTDYFSNDSAPSPGLSVTPSAGGGRK